MSITAVTQSPFPRFHSQKNSGKQVNFYIIPIRGSKWIASCFLPKMAVLLWPWEIMHSHELQSHCTCLTINWCTLSYYHCERSNYNFFSVANLKTHRRKPLACLGIKAITFVVNIWDTAQLVFKTVKSFRIHAMRLALLAGNVITLFIHFHDPIKENEIWC